MIEGVLAIQAGENPNVIRERLMGFLPPKQRKGKDEE
jgi:chemotaxis protein MotA